MPYPFPSREEGLKIENGGPGINFPAERDRVGGGGQVSELVGIAGYDHGVKEAEKMNQSENASEFYPCHPGRLCNGKNIHHADPIFYQTRHLDPTSARIRHPQKLHIHPDPLNSSCDAEGSQSAQGMGMGYRQTATEREQQQEDLSHMGEFFVYMEGSSPPLPA